MIKFMEFSESIRNTFDNDETELQTFSRLMVDTANNAVVEFSIDKANTAIRNKMFAVLGLDVGANRREIRKAIRKHKVDVYEIIEDTLENMLVTGWGENPFFKEFVETQNYADGDRGEFYVADESILTISKLSGNHHDVLRQKLGFGESFTVKTDWYGCKVYAEFELFMAGRLDWANFINKVYEAYDRHVNNMIYRAVMDASDKLPNNSQWVKNIQLVAENKDTILTLIEDVQAATGKEVVVMGTKSALAKLSAIADVNWISDNMKEERHTTGKLGIWESTRLVEIPQVFAPNDTTKKMVDNTKLMFMPVGDNQFVKLYNEGEMQIAEVSDGDARQDKTIEYEIQAKIGIAVVLSLRFGVVNIKTA